MEPRSLGSSRSPGNIVTASVGLFAAIVVLIIFGSPVVHSGNLALLLAAVAPAAFENALS